MTLLCKNVHIHIINVIFMWKNNYNCTAGGIRPVGFGDSIRLEILVCWMDLGSGAPVQKLDVVKKVVMIAVGFEPTPLRTGA